MLGSKYKVVGKAKHNSRQDDVYDSLEEFVSEALKRLPACKRRSSRAFLKPNRMPPCPRMADILKLRPVLSSRYSAFIAIGNRFTVSASINEDRYLVLIFPKRGTYIVNVLQKAKRLPISGLEIFVENQRIVLG